MDATGDVGTGNAPTVRLLAAMVFVAVFLAARGGIESGLKREPKDVATERVPNDVGADSMLSEVSQADHHTG
jgi:hypothetical protein